MEVKAENLENARLLDLLLGFNLADDYAEAYKLIENGQVKVGSKLIEDSDWVFPFYPIIEKLKIDVTVENKGIHTIIVNP